MPSFKVPRLTRGRTLAAVTAASVIGSVLVAAAPVSAQVVSCNSHTKNWAALYPNVFDKTIGSGATACIGFVSTNYLASNNTEIFCAGNNSGVVTYYDETTGTSATHTFWPDGSYYVNHGVYTQAGPIIDPRLPDLIDVEIVQITGYAGSAGC